MHILSILAFPLGLAAATKFQAFYSPDCSSGAGSEVTVKGSGRCSNTQGRFSYRVTGDDCKIHTYGDTKECKGETYNRTYYLNDGECLMNVPPFANACIIGVHDKAGDGIGHCPGVTRPS